MSPHDIDRSDAADARRFRWLLDGNGYYMQEQRLCGYPPCSDVEKDEARAAFDAVIAAAERRARATKVRPS